MSEADYEYEVMRCELLGLPPPERQPLPPKSSNDEEGEDFHVDEENIESDQQVEVESEQLKNTSGRLDELNSILNVTQKKLNRFKAVCGSLTSLLKIRVPSSGKDTASSSNLSSRASIASNTEGQAEAEAAPSSDDTATATSTTKPTGRTAPRDIDRTTQLGSQIDALDSILDKAEHAEMSMSHQNKIMKSFLK